MKMRKLFYILPLLGMIVSCSDRPDMVVPDDTMKSLLVDLHKSEAYLAMGSPQFTSDSAKRVLRQSVLSRHGVTQAEFDSSLNWYGHHIDEYVELYGEVEKELQAQLAEARNRAEKSGEMATASLSDADNLWQKSRMQRISWDGDCNHIDFEITEQNGLQKGDKVRWQFRRTNAQSSVEMFMAVEYGDELTSYSSRTMSGNTNVCQMSIQTDSTRVPTRVYGYAKFGLKKGEMVFVDSIQIEKTPLVASTYNQIFSQREFIPLQFKIKDDARLDSIDAVNAGKSVLPEPKGTLRSNEPMISPAELKSPASMRIK